MCGAGLWENSVRAIVPPHRLPHEQEAPQLSRLPEADHLLNTQDSRGIVGMNMNVGLLKTMDRYYHHNDPHLFFFLFV